MSLDATKLNERSSSETPRWKRALFYVGLVVFIVALNYLVARNEGRPKRDAPAKPSSATNRKQPKPDEPSNQANTKGNQRTESGKPSNADRERTNDANNHAPAANSKPTTRSESQPPTNDGDDTLTIRNMRIRNEDGRTIYSGDVDLRPTLDRIERGKRLRFPNDGVVFENRERRLPAKPSGYYHEYVLPTRGNDGPGPQRIVTGRDGETYYTPDHYRTFRRIK